MLGVLAVLSAACGGADATPTRTRVAQAEPTQTPWIIYIPVTVTPGPATATLEPTSTPNGPPPTAVPPTRAPANTRPPQPTKEPQPTTPAESPTPAPPPPTAAPTCGQTYQVTKLIDPSPNGVVRDVINNSRAGKTLQFKWDPVVAYELPTNIGYRVNVSTNANSVALYISHNAYLQEQVAILSAQGSYGLTLGDDRTASWNVDVIMASGEFNDAGDDTQPPLGTVTVCGPSSPTWTIELHVME